MKENRYKISSKKTIETIDILYHFLSCDSPFFESFICQHNWIKRIPSSVQQPAFHSLYSALTAGIKTIRLFSRVRLHQFHKQPEFWTIPA